MLYKRKAQIYNMSNRNHRKKERSMINHLYNLFKTFINNHKAGSEVLGGILMFAATITLYTIVATKMVPVWDQQAELEQLEGIENQVLGLTACIDSAMASGQPTTCPIDVGFKYPNYRIFPSKKQPAFGTLDIERDLWISLSYDETLPDGTFIQSIEKNITSSTISLSIGGVRGKETFELEHGIMRVLGTNFSEQEQEWLTENNLYIMAINTTGERLKLAAGGQKSLIVTPISIPSSSIVSTNLTLKFITRYPEWWVDQFNLVENVTASFQGNIVSIDFGASSMGIKIGEVAFTDAGVAIDVSNVQRPTRMIKFSGNGSTIPVGTQQVLVVEVRDDFNNVVPGINVNFTVTLGGGVVSPNNMTTTSNGRAFTILTADPKAGPNYVEASSEGLASITFTVWGGTFGTDIDTAKPNFPTIDDMNICIPYGGTPGDSSVSALITNTSTFNVVADMTEITGNPLDYALLPTATTPSDPGSPPNSYMAFWNVTNIDLSGKAVVTSTVNANNNNMKYLETMNRRVLTQADYLTVDKSDAGLTSDNKGLEKIYLGNSYDCTAVVIDKVSVSWEPSSGPKWKKVAIDGVTFWSDSAVSAGTLINGPDHAIDAGSSNIELTLDFSSTMHTVNAFTIELTMGDGSINLFKVYTGEEIVVE